MGNKLSCSCAPLIRKAYRYEDSPWQTSRRRDGHLLSRLWAEVFHVSASGAGTVKWQQVSEDLVPVNITCIQDSPDCVFHITAYNSQVDKILDVRLVQPGTRIGQASECFVYWKDPMTNDTWGLNFTSPIDAKQFRECCSPSFKFSRKASSSYSLRLEPPKQKVKAKRKPLSTPASPSRSREPQCTCMTPEQYARLRAQDPRYRSSTLPRAQSVRSASGDDGTTRSEKVAAATSSTSLYDNVQGGPKRGEQAYGSMRQQRSGGVGGNSQPTPQDAAKAANHVAAAQQTATSDATQQTSAGRQPPPGGNAQPGTRRNKQLNDLKQQYYSDAETSRDDEFRHKRAKSKSTDDMTLANERNISLDSNTLKRMLKPMPSVESPVTSPEMSRRRYNRHHHGGGHHHHHHGHIQRQDMGSSFLSEPESGGPYHRPASAAAGSARFSNSRSAHEFGRGLYLELERERGDNSPPSDNVLFDNQCYATTPSSSNGNNSDMEPQGQPNSASTPGSPTSRLLLEYEMHLRNTLAKGMDAESYSLHTFEALLTQSMENLESAIWNEASNNRHLHNNNNYNNNHPHHHHHHHPHSHLHGRRPAAKTSVAAANATWQASGGQKPPTGKRTCCSQAKHHNHKQASTRSIPGEFAENLPTSNQRSPYPARRRPGSSASLNKSSTLPLPNRGAPERPASAREPRERDRDRDGYYSDRNELARERERDRGYLSDHNSRCASCQSEPDEPDEPEVQVVHLTSRQAKQLAWSRQHNKAIKGGGGGGGGGGRTAWDSLPSLRRDGSLTDSAALAPRADSFDQRSSMFDRTDSFRSSDYLSDRESRYGIVQQASVESADSRLCYLTSSEMSDDDRMSLTTAVSDDDDVESVHNSPYRAKQTGTAAASFNCTGAVRKAGFLSVKKWLLRKKHQIELARKRGWKGYWVCLKGTTLLFYPCDSREGRSVEAAPKHLIIVDGAIMQPIPEHPKRDHIFCLSTAFGDAYLFQAPCQVELENWVNSIHSACAAAFARHRGKTGTLHLLQEEIFRLDKAIESDHKLKHMADLQQSVVSDAETKRQITGQIVQWEENLERLHCEQFRLRCYMASLQNGELPNPKSLLTHVSRATKNTLNRLGVFTVSSFHAFICARSPSLLNNLLAGRGATKRRAPMLSRSNSGSSRRSLQLGGSGSREESNKAAKVLLPEGQSATVILREAMSVEEFLVSACSRKNLNPMEHFLRVKKRKEMEDHNYFVPHRTDLVETYLHTHEVVEVCAKILYQVELQRATLEQMWGFSVEAELIENSERQDELCCYVSRVEDKSVAMQNGIIKGDEIMVINGAIVSDLDMMYLESVLQEELSLCMMMRSSRTEPPDIANLMRGTTDDMIDSLVCPPPPSDGLISEEVISNLIVPAPGWAKEMYSPETESSPVPSSEASKASRANSFEIDNLLKTAEQVTGFCRSPVETRKSSPTGSIISSQSQQAVLTPSRQLTDTEKLRKVILELIETERTYVKHLNSLLENYLEPLKRETFLSNAEINALFGNIQEIVAFQRQFLQNLDEALEMEPEFHKLEHPGQFKNVLFSIGSAFLYYVNHFKLYSSFCASHSKAQKVLHPNEGNQALQEFLAARNPRQQHSSTLESYLIKPIQRILKYPLLLQQLRNLTSPQCDEHQHLVEALKGMEKVAEHINEMQRIHEEYGAIFDHLFRQHQKSCKQPIDLSLGDLLYYGGVEWLNISDFLGKIKKGLELHAMCFVFKSAVVFLCKERLRQKKKLMGVASKANTSEVEIIRYQVLIPVTEVQVRASSAKDMDSHFLWELIHLRSQLQRRSEKVYVLSNSSTNAASSRRTRTGEFRNAFLKTIRQIIRESVRNMSIPATKPLGNGCNGGGGSSSGEGGSEKGMKPTLLPASGPGAHNSHTLGKPKKPPKGSQRHSAGNIDYDNVEVSREEDGKVVAVVHPEGSKPFRARSKTVSDGVPPEDMAPLLPSKQEMSSNDAGSKSEGEDDSIATVTTKKPTLGRTPNHLSLSTTSTLSAGSTGSQARLIQSSHQPENYAPQPVKELGSPVWKPRDMLGEAATLPRKGKTTGTTTATINSAPGDSRSLKKFTDYGGGSSSKPSKK
ncbi:protein still life, isoform SIF type 1 isoform X4 [Neocloeon triangulifer]|uniref:protein still life, isoform SIF type 1 isoform X4 n=1 Tax=Neocloeon triangulifer TaxID=2078957 RepID=UPI00286F62A0|nr:protein still life, isoform SIF type 1 isoform X4 [Neocloeon triangulifer]